MGFTVYWALVSDISVVPWPLNPPSALADRNWGSLATVMKLDARLIKLKSGRH